ncbi:hypothetical protein LTR09_006531 [Extremus antarcticus]|uniref:Uncharacterized protein n=1 Tax=Extremus antarcticus TaxID=702011 RepID=A0AAJ0DE23_9PEZI|nr:hypothetical protein LTR09_006531 [Extremus antarcticus]
MSFDAGGLAQMTYNNSNNGYSNNGFGASGASFGNRSRFSSKRLSVALPPKVNPISEDQVDNPTPRTSRSHLLAGLRTQPKTPQVPASAPFNQTQHHSQGLGASKWGGAGYDAYDQDVPQTATGAGFHMQNQYSMNAGRQVYALPEQVLAPPTLYDDGEDVDPAVLEEMQMRSFYLAQRQQQLQQQLANITAQAQGLNVNTNFARNPYQQGPMTPQTPQSLYGNQQMQMQSPIEVQPGVYLVYNPAIQGYSYAYDQSMQQQNNMSPVHQAQGSAYFNSPQAFQPPTPTVSVTPPANDVPNPMGTRSFSPPKQTPSPPSALEHVEPLPPPSSNAFRRGHAHKKTASLSINPMSEGVLNGPMTSSNATFGSQRTVVPAGPMTGTFGPGAARNGEHPLRQPRGPPPLDELTALPTSNHEGSKNFVSRQRRRALDNLVKAGSSRRGLSRSSAGSPVSDRELNFSISEEGEDKTSVTSAGSRKMSPIGSEMKVKRGSQGSDGGYFGLSSASSSEGEDFGTYKQPPTPSTPIASGGERKKLMLGVINAAEKRRSIIS